MWHVVFVCVLTQMEQMKIIIFFKIIGKFNYGKCFGYLVTWQTTPELGGLKTPDSLFPYNFVTRSALLRDSSLLHLA